MREVKRAARFIPTISEGIAQPARMRHMHQVGVRILLPSPFCPCGVVQPTCLPLMQEITGAKPVRDATLSARGLRGIADPPDSESGSLGRASRLAPTNLTRSAEFGVRNCLQFRVSTPHSAFRSAPKALAVMRSLGRRANSVQLRVGDPASQSSQRSSRFHKPAPPRAALGIATILKACKH